MTTILQVEASARKARSLSRGLARDFRESWRGIDADAVFIERDVGTHPPPFVSEDWIAAAFTPDGERTAAQEKVLAASSELIGEVRQADVIVIATPMYNYGMPAALKAWFDQVIRVDETFTFDLARGDWPLEPALAGKHLVLLTAAGEFGFGPRGVREAFGHLEPHVVTCSRYLGVEEVYSAGVEYQEFGDERYRRSLESARRRTRELAHRLALQRVGHVAESCRGSVCCATPGFPDQEISNAKTKDAKHEQ